MAVTKEDSIRERNQGSKFSALNDLTKMEEDEVNTSCQTESGEGVEAPSLGELSGSRIRKEPKVTQASKEDKADVVRVNVSHAWMTSSMRPFHGLTRKVSTQKLGSKVFNGQALKEITNKNDGKA